MCAISGLLAGHFLSWKPFNLGILNGVGFEAGILGFRSHFVECGLIHSPRLTVTSDAI